MASSNMSALQNMLAVQLESHLRNRLAPAADVTQLIDNSTEEEFDRFNANDLFSWLGRRPASVSTLSSCIDCVLRTLESHSFGAGSSQLGGHAKVLKTILDGYSVEDRTSQLALVYQDVLKRLVEDGVDLSSLRVVAMVCAGGVPFRHYGACFGLGDTAGPLDAVVEAHVSLAKKHGIVFDIIPLLFYDFNHNILAMAAGVGAVLLAKLRARDSGHMRCDGCMFACKGTLAAALALASYLQVEAASDTKKPIAMVGMGTDLSQGFFDIALPSFKALSPTIAFNSLQDTAVGGHGRRSLDNLLKDVRECRLCSGDAQAEPVHSLELQADKDSRGDLGVTGELADSCHEAVWYDIDAHLSEFGWAVNPDHNWYDMAFTKPAASWLKDDMLQRLSKTVFSVDRHPAVSDREAEQA